jgi:hypothetical protein
MRVDRRCVALWGCLTAAVLITAARIVTLRAEEPSGDAGQIVVGRPAELSDPRLAAARGETPPAPTEIAQWKAARKDHRRERQAWYESLHWAEPGVDWQAIEAANREALALERYARIDRGERTEYWDELGSVDLAGRTHAAYPSSDGTQLYVGSDLGGVWRGTLDGQNWTALSDGLGRGSHQLLVVPPGAGPGASEIVFTLTGTTVHATADGGQTWFVPAGLPEQMWTVKRIVHDAAQPRTVYLLVNGRKYVGGSYQTGYLVMRSTNGGLDFEYRGNLGGSPPCDLWIDRVAGGALYAMDGNTLCVSHDGGLSFQALGSAPSGASLAGVLLTGSEAGAPTFYAALEEGSTWKLYRSGDGGVQWTWCYDIPDFWETLVASISDPDLVFFAGVECFRSNDGGLSFTKLNEWWEYYDDPVNKLHADLPGMDIHWVNGQEVIYFNTDGGTYVSHDGGQTVQNLSLWGLAISQYYSTFTSATDPYLIAAGSQDQGYQQSRPGSRQPYLPFEQLISGDYGHLTSATRNHNWLYSVYPGFVLLQKNENSPYTLMQLDFPDCQHSWMPAITADPRDTDVFYFCGDHLWKYERLGAGYYYVKTELPQDFGATGGYLTGLAISPADYNYWYAATNQGNLWFSHDAGAHWTQTTHGPGAHYFYGTAVVASPTTRDVAYAGGSGYNGHAVWRTEDGGVHWGGIGTGLPQTLVLGLTLGGLTGETPYAACEAGPYGYDETQGEWVNLLGTEAPLTTYWCVEWVPEIGAVRFGTYGRGIWDYIPIDPADVTNNEAGQGRRAPSGANRLQLAVGPNPASDRLDVGFRLSTGGQVRAELFDVSGRRVAVLADGEFAVGDHHLRADLAPEKPEAGLYLVRVSAPEGVAVRKVQVLQ